MEFIYNLGCNNSPKGAFVQTYVEKLVMNDFKSLKELSSDSIQVTLPNSIVIDGKDNLSELKNHLPTSFDKVISITATHHGKDAAYIGKYINGDSSLYFSVHI